MRAQFFDGFDFAEYKYSIVAIEHVHAAFAECFNRIHI